MVAIALLAATTFLQVGRPYVNQYVACARRQEAIDTAGGSKREDWGHYVFTWKPGVCTMNGNALQVLVDGEIVLLLRACHVDYSEYYYAITHASPFPDGNSVDRGVGYGRTPGGQALEMKYRVLPGIGLELREIRALTDQDYTRRLNRALARRAR